MYVIDHMVWSIAVAVAILAVATLPALLLVAAYERGSWQLWSAAAALSLLFSYPAGLQDLLSDGDWQEALFRGFATISPPLISAAALVGGIGGTSFWPRTLAAASVGVLTVALPVMAILVSSGPWDDRLMAVAAIALLLYAILRHLWQRGIVSRRSGRDTPA